MERHVVVVPIFTVERLIKWFLTHGLCLVRERVQTPFIIRARGFSVKLSEALPRASERQLNRKLVAGASAVCGYFGVCVFVCVDARGR